MDSEHLQSYFGQECSVVVRCRPCGGIHTVEGSFEPGWRKGDVLIGDRTYPSSDLISLRPLSPEAPAISSGTKLAAYPWLVWAALAALALLLRR